MDAGAFIFARLGGHTDAEERVYPLKTPEGTKGASITYQRISSVLPAHLMGTGIDLKRIRMQVDCWATTYADARAIAAQVESRLNRFKGTLNGLTIHDVFMDNEGEFYESDTQTRRVSQDYTLLIGG